MKEKVLEIIKNLEKRNITGYFANTKEQGLAIALSFVREGMTVSWGGSMTLEETGLKTEIRRLEQEGKIRLIDAHSIKDPKLNHEARRRSLLADLYYMSTNAITLGGELMNIDGFGNRVAALAFGPEKVVILCGTNKITDNLEDAYKRIKEVACPKNAARLGRSTPCIETGRCCECLVSNSTLCGTVTTTRFSNEKGRIHVILIDDSLGF